MWVYLGSLLSCQRLKCPVSHEASRPPSCCHHVMWLGRRVTLFWTSCSRRTLWTRVWTRDSASSPRRWRSSMTLWVREKLSDIEYFFFLNTWVKDLICIITVLWHDMQPLIYMCKINLSIICSMLWMFIKCYVLFVDDCEQYVSFLHAS